MSENTQPEQNPLGLNKPTEVPAGYDQPAPVDTPVPPAYGTPSYGQPDAPAPEAPAYQQPQGYPQQNVQPGAPYQQPYQQPGFAVAGAQKSKVVAGVLGILLGSLGIHNFYLGYNKKALIQLLVSVLSFGFLAWAIGIWGLIEGILILVGSENFRTDANGVPLKE
ncbi:TM2 domain-containing membrane protein YozV [Arthrobacter stackebrandtii]|uniref:TM2 domain-containing membrane protein YozV n=1 Tax=Arthrobacter stackebrandtii TaxID=272161 RepID=A0ABS4YVH0_9MICC|nr:TM2 domain-containing protein [Arthrobacter stackebrandtii]MBP2411928.1 TM2 domain-containing membrane protein YozV [Arthrobacter stackebrandtii]PYG99809.1 TM2 domain-containing protein [Arthrobacter stackebrandtii]